MDRTSEKVLKELENMDVITERNEENCLPAVIKKNVCYIVASVIIQDDKVLMMREARADCYGTWYLPAGKVEPNESLIDAAAREVKEETGLEVSLSSLMTVENAFGGFWYRFTYAGQVTGGKLKDESMKDSESLEAAWLPIADVKSKKVKLRANDAIKLIEVGEKWYKSPQNNAKFHTLPILTKHVTCSLRIFLLQCENDVINVFVTSNAEQTLRALPAVILDNISSRFGVETTLHSTLLECGFYGTATILGVLSVEHCPSEGQCFDGICFNIACEAASGSEKSFHESKGTFIRIEETGLELREIVNSKACVSILFT